MYRIACANLLSLYGYSHCSQSMGSQDRASYG